jgi:hypothetical protein
LERINPSSSLFPCHLPYSALAFTSKARDSGVGDILLDNAFGTVRAATTIYG